MFKIKVSKEIIDHCENQLNQYNFGKRSTANGNREQQLTGLIGQSTIQHLFGLPLIDGSKGCDEGTDIVINGYKIDIKTMGRTTEVRPDFVNNFIALQAKFDTDIYIFCSFHKLQKELTVCGFCTKEHFFKKADFFKKGTTRTRSDKSSFTLFADLYEIKNTDLMPVNSFEELNNQLHSL